jgi:hypothetical protein
MAPLSEPQTEAISVDVDKLGLTKRRRIWGTHENAALLAEIDAQNGKVRLMAGRHGISKCLL